MKGRIRFATALLSALVAGSLLHPGLAVGNPEGPSGTSGITSITGLGTSQVTINQGAPLAIINWRSFNIAPNELTRFIQPSSSSWALNRIFDVNPSRILGSLQANGGLILLNSNGIMFGPHAQINVNGLIASSLNLADADFLKGNWGFLGTASNGWVKNAGTINAGTGGVYLLAPNVENSGVITDHDGHIVLTAGTSVLLSSRPDGRGLFVEVQAPSGTARNLGDLIADGGEVGLYGRVVNQEGLIQANSVRERNGRIELVASEQVTLKAGSRTVAKGADQGVSDGGTIIAVADKATGRATFERGALIDVSGGTNGGHGGFAEVSGRDVTLGGRFKANAAPGYRGGGILVDPVFVDLSGVSVFGASSLTFSSPDDLTVTGSLDVSQAGSLGPGNVGTLTFTAGQDLVFNFASISNDANGNALSRWDYLADAGRDIILNGSNIWISGGGTMDVHAGRDLKLGPLDFAGDGSFLWYSNLRTLGAQGGNIVLDVGRDLLAPSVQDPTFGNAVTGIRLDGPGDLTITARNFLGTEIAGDFSGTPINEALKNPGFLLSNGAATITLTGDFGQAESYGVITLGALDQGKKVTINAGGSIYMGGIVDRGLFEGTNPIAGDAQPLFTFSPHNNIALISGGGDIHLNPTIHASNPNSPAPDRFLEFYPASFEATASQGSVLIESDLNFWPSLTGSVRLSAFRDIAGNAKEVTVRIVLGPEFGPREGEVVFVTQRPTPVVRLSKADPAALQTVLAENLVTAEGQEAQHLPSHDPVPVTVKTTTGDIRDLKFDFLSPAKKNVTLDAGQDLRQFVAFISVAEGAQALVKAGRDINMTRPPDRAKTDSGLQFRSDGTVAVEAGGDIDLGDSLGIGLKGPRDVALATNPGDVLDIALGGNIEMIQSKIVTYNGQSIRIRGLGGTDTSVGGAINVGTNQNSFGQDTGIITLRGGDIDIKAIGDVNVNSSRIATFGGGDIRIASTAGDINAGTGGRNEVTDFAFETTPLDADGNPLGPRTFFTAQVPGSGIFTFHPDDPLPLAFPAFNDPAIIALRNEITKQGFLGHDTTALQNQLIALTAERQRIFNEQIFNPFIDSLKLGSIFLKAKNVIVPPAGIRGKDIVIEAENLTLEGGTIEGRTTVDVATITGNLSSFVGTFSGTTGAGAVVGSNSGGSSLTPLAGTSGGVAAAGATAGASTTAKKSVESVTETAVEATPQAKATTASAKAANTGGSGKNEEKKPALRIKKGVTIAVEVKPEKPL